MYESSFTEEIIQESRNDPHVMVFDAKIWEVKNANTCDDIGFVKEDEEDIKKNEIEKDDEGEEELEDDADADKDYWKEKANALEVKNAEIENELKKYHIQP